MALRRSRKFATALVGCLGACFMLMLTGAPMAPLSDATASSLSGSAYSGNTSNKIAGVAVYLYKWDAVNQREVNLGRAATTNSSGNYTRILPGSTWYYVQGVKVYGTNCYPYGRIFRLDGYSAWTWLPPNSSANASFRMFTTYSC